LPEVQKKTKIFRQIITIEPNINIVNNYYKTGNAFFTKPYKVSYLGFLQIIITGIGTGTVQLEQMGGNRDQVGEAVRTVY